MSLAVAAKSWLDQPIDSTAFEFYSIEVPYSAVVIAIFMLLGCLMVVAFLAETLIEVFSSFRGKMLHKFTVQQPVVGYKVATVRGQRLHGISGGGGYNFEDEKSSGPGFHCFKSPDLLLASSYIDRGELILEVLLSGDIYEHTKGYVGTRQRVLQVTPNPRAGGRCRHCYSIGCELYVDLDLQQKLKAQGNSVLNTLCCESCQEPALVSRQLLRRVMGKKPQSRYRSLSEHIALMATRSSSKPVGFVNSVSEMVRTEIPRRVPRRKVNRSLAR